MILIANRIGDTGSLAINCTDKYLIKIIMYFKRKVKEHVTLDSIRGKQNHCLKKNINGVAALSSNCKSLKSS